MKILIINTYDVQGGAARAAYRLHQSLLDAGIDSRMLVQSKVSDDPKVIGPQTKFQKIIAKLRPLMDNRPVRFYRQREGTIFTPAWFPWSGLGKRIRQIDPDIVHLHWVAGGMLCIEELASIDYPIVWSLHDMWLFTGGCHYDNNCDKYKK